MYSSTGHSYELFCTKSVLSGVGDVDLIATVEFSILHAVAVGNALTFIAGFLAFRLIYCMPVSSQHYPLEFWAP